MNQETVKRAGEIINSKTDYIGDGMEGYAVLTLIDEDGYPVSSTMSIAKADGVNWLTFFTDTGGTKAQKIAKNNKACVCLASSEYHISLTGTAEIITDPAVKKEHWQKVLTDHYKVDSDDETWCLLKFSAKKYSIYLVDTDSEARGEL